MWTSSLPPQMSIHGRSVFQFWVRGRSASEIHTEIIDTVGRLSVTYGTHVFAIEDAVNFIFTMPHHVFKSHHRISQRVSHVLESMVSILDFRYINNLATHLSKSPSRTFIYSS